MPIAPLTIAVEASSDTQPSRPIRVLAFMEARFVTGPAKNLIEFARLSRQADSLTGRAEVTIATFQRGDIDEPNAFIRAARDAGLTVKVIPERQALDFSVLRKMCSVLDECRPDILQTHNVKSHFLVRLMGAPRDFPWIAYHHGYTRTDLKDVAYNQLNRWSLRRACRVVTVCEAFAADLRRIGIPGERISVRHNMVKLFVPASQEQVEALRTKHAIPSNALVGVCIGRLSREKGHVDLVHALAQLRHRDLPVVFRIIVVGDGPERARLQQEARRLGLDDVIIFAGFDAGTAPYYTLADFAVLPSHSEGSPNALLEAMSAGLPTVATRVGGTPEIVVDGESAIIVSKRDPADLARGIERILTDAPLRTELAKAAGCLVSRYSPAEYAKDVLGIYRSVLAAAGEAVKAADISSPR